uniref:Repressor of RNA polymerase III transcription n=1 Tax=Cryptomonas curvata TaxID=233186 RepID=A0A7S0M5M4_9CRYP|mmetsp:Transcript_25722/g.53460  ORF Transcript_25722/g.53460 Transcript_25722/m.53460 type:complete len:249 (+) Transcript_25722:151-897(+)
MKYLECPPITELDVALQSGINVGEYIVQGRLEIYSCKLAPSEKKLASSLEKQWVGSPPAHHLVLPEDHPGASPASLGSAAGTAPGSAGAPGSSPLGSVGDSATRKLLINLILTLNNSFADYDFRDLRPEDFVREASVEMVMNSVNAKLSRVEDGEQAEFCGRLWKALDHELSLKECDVYSYVADMDQDALSLGKIWSVNYFLYNKKLKKLAFFACWVKSQSRSRSMEDDSDRDGMDSDDDGMDFDDME